jgi:hypothetical protein
VKLEGKKKVGGSDQLGFGPSGFPSIPFGYAQSTAKFRVGLDARAFACGIGQRGVRACRAFACGVASDRVRFDSGQNQVVCCLVVLTSNPCRVRSNWVRFLELV